MQQLTSLSKKCLAFIEREKAYGAHNYEPLPVVLTRGKDVFVWDVDGKRYFDFISAYSTVNQGHRHPRILAAFMEQARRLTLTSRAFYNDQLGEFYEYITKLFGYDKVIPMNSGAEAVETALKLCRKWAYEVKGIKDDKAKIVVCENNYHGRTISLISFSTDRATRNNFGPYTPNFIVVPYNNLPALRKALQEEDVAGFLVEPIQGEAGVIVPDDRYLAEAQRYCKEAGVLFIGDEIQTGLCRTGRLLCSDYESVHPDILILGKALSGGMMPVSAVLADNEIMLTLGKGEHGSTFGGNPLACKVAVTALQVLVDEKMADNAKLQGEYFRKELMGMNSPLIHAVAGKGLFNVIVVRQTDPQTAWNLCLAFRKRGLLAKPTHQNRIRLAPPLTITSKQIDQCLGIIKSCLSRFEG